MSRNTSRRNVRHVSPTRRRFLQSCAAGGLLYAFGRTPGTVLAEAAGVNGFNDYKAMVCVFLFGGNDSWSMVVPRSDAEYAAYAQARQNLAIERDALLPINRLDDGPALGMHPSMGGLAGLFESGRCAIVANVGPLLQPTTRAQIEAGSALLPPQLFSHNDQQDQWHSLRGRSVGDTGWAGRMADTLAAQLASQTLATNVSLAGNTLFQAGTVATPYVMGASGATTFNGLGGDDPLAVARRTGFQAVLDANHASVYERAYAEVQKRALRYADTVNGALAAAPPLTAPFPANSQLATQLRTVARMIAVRERLGMTRQVFFVATGGFDTHDNQLEDQPRLLGDVSASLAAFHAATVELGVASQVTTFTQSDFGRTLTSNGDGSDHAWGGVQLVVGDGVRGRTVYGDYPLLQLDGVADLGGGRFIPAVSSDQYAATLAQWFGVADAQLPAIAPSLANFPQKNLGFMV